MKGVEKYPIGQVWEFLLRLGPVREINDTYLFNSEMDKTVDILICCAHHKLLGRVVQNGSKIGLFKGWGAAWRAERSSS